MIILLGSLDITMSLFLLLTIDPNLGRVDYALISEQTLMEMLIGDVFVYLIPDTSLFRNNRMWKSETFANNNGECLRKLQEIVLHISFCM